MTRSSRSLEHEAVKVMIKDRTVGCVEFAVPGRTLEDKLRLLEKRGMWLEMANDGKKEVKDVLKVLPSYRTPIKSVQAYLLHELQILGGREEERKAAVRHVEGTMAIASKIGAQNVVTTITYGKPSIDNPRERCIETFKQLGRLGEELDVNISIEPLGRKRTTFLPSVSDIHQLVQEVGSSHVRLMADTMHIHDNGEDVEEVIEEFAEEIAELQLRDTGSKPPGKGEIEFAPVVKVIRRKRFRGLVCLEYKPGKNPAPDFDHASEFATYFISAVR